VRNDRERLRDILKAIDHVLDKTTGGREAFNRDEMVQVWVLHHLQVIGEASRSLSEEFKRRQPDKAWSKAAGMRHILVHQYFEIDADQVWNVVERDLPALRAKVMQVLAQEGPAAEA